MNFLFCIKKADPFQENRILFRRIGFFSNSRRFERKKMNLRHLLKFSSLKRTNSLLNETELIELLLSRSRKIGNPRTHKGLYTIIFYKKLFKRKK